MSMPPESEGQRLATQCAAALWQGDTASQSLGMQLRVVAPGRATLTMRVRPDMVNGHRICHGGLIFTLADSAFAFACNSRNETTVAAAGSIDFLAAAREGDELEARAQELWRTRRNGLYEVTVSNQTGERIALFRGRAYSLGRAVLPETAAPVAGD
jgi:acyl-CoA thioesterase